MSPSRNLLHSSQRGIPRVTLLLAQFTNFSDLSDSKVGGVDHWKTASTDFVDHGVELDDDQGVGFDLP